MENDEQQESPNEILRQSQLPSDAGPPDFWALIDYPTAGSVVKGPVVHVAGIAYVSGAVHIYDITGGQRVLVGIGGGALLWWAAICLMSPGPRTIVARVDSQGQVDGPPVTFTYVYENPTIPPPVIDTHQNGDLVDTDLWIGGSGTYLASVQAFRDLTENLLGTSIVGYVGEEPGPDPARWRMRVYLSPGIFTISAMQSILTNHSSRGAPLSLRVRPPQLANISVTYPTETSVRFSGPGHTGATVEIWYQGGNGGVQWTAQVQDGYWYKDVMGWVPDNYIMSLLQKVPDGHAGYIHSEWTDVPVTVPVPRPTLNPPSNLPSQKPRFSGTGTAWEGQPATQVQIQLNQAAHPFVPDTTVTGSAWQVTATQELAPGTYVVRARQVFKGQASSWVDLPGSMIIPAPLPTIVDISENAMSPDISGTCWAGAQVKLWYDDAAGTVHLPTVTGTTWRFRRPESFAPGPHKVSVTQTFGGQASGEVSGTFTIAVSRPVITRPIGVPVGHETSVEGRGGFAGSVMKIFDYVTDLPLGEETVTGANWSVALRALEYGSHTVYARQFFDGYLSEKSERVTFEVVLLAPDIDVPRSGDDVARTFRIEGRARIAAEVELWLDGVVLDRVWANVRGDWWYRATLPLGAGVLQARQFLDERESELSPDHRIRVVPAKPVMETPSAGQAVERRMAICGFGYPGDTVTVARVGAPDKALGSAVVQENTTWWFWADLDAVAGPCELKAQQSCQGYDSGWSDARAIVLRTDPPQFVEPLSGRWVSHRPRFKGIATSAAPLELTAWYNREVKLAEDVPITGAANWQVEPVQSMPQGAGWASARHMDSKGEPVSASGESERFEVLPPEDPSLR